MNETSRTVKYLYKNQTLSLSEICETEGLKYKLVYDRINILKMSLEDALFHDKYKGGPPKGYKLPAEAVENLRKSVKKSWIKRKQKYGNSKTS